MLFDMVTKRTTAALPNIVDLLLDAVFLVDLEGRIVYVSAACERIFGYKPEEMTGKAMMDFVAPQDREKTRREAATVIAGEPRIGFENRYVRKDGSLVHLMWSARWSEADQLRIGVARDVTEQRRGAEMQAATYAISEAAHAATDLVTMFREINRIIAGLVPTAGFAVALRRTDDDGISLPCHAGLSGGPESGDAAMIQQLFDEVISTGETASRPPEPRDGKRKEAWVALPLLCQSGLAGALILKSDPHTRYGEKDRELLQFVSVQVATALERRRLRDELLHAARHDELTGLPNRRLFQDRLTSALARASRHGERIALLYVDVDDFKQINDTFGHASGDRLLAEFARRLQQCVRGEDTVARIGGDEFVVLLEEIKMPDDAHVVADKIAQTVGQPVHLDDHMLCAQSSIGIALYPDHGGSAEQLLRYADMTMYRAKKAKVAGV